VVRPAFSRSHGRPYRARKAVSWSRSGQESFHLFLDGRCVDNIFAITFFKVQWLKSPVVMGTSSG